MEKEKCSYCGKTFETEKKISNAANLAFCSEACYYHFAGCTVPKELDTPYCMNPEPKPFK